MNFLRSKSDRNKYLFNYFIHLIKTLGQPVHALPEFPHRPSERQRRQVPTNTSTGISASSTTTCDFTLTVDLPVRIYDATSCSSRPQVVIIQNCSASGVPPPPPPCAIPRIPRRFEESTTIIGPTTDTTTTGKMLSKMFKIM